MVTYIINKMYIVVVYALSKELYLCIVGITKCVTEYTFQPYNMINLKVRYLVLSILKIFEKCIEEIFESMVSIEKNRNQRSRHSTPIPPKQREFI